MNIIILILIFDFINNNSGLTCVGRYKHVVINGRYLVDGNNNPGNKNNISENQW